MRNSSDIRKFINIVQHHATAATYQLNEQADNQQYCDGCGAPIHDTAGGWKHDEAWRNSSCPAKPEPKDDDSSQQNESMLVEFDSTTSNLVDLVSKEHLRGMRPLLLKHHAVGLAGNVETMPNREIFNKLKQLQNLVGEGTGQGLLALLNKAELAKKNPDASPITENDIEIYERIIDKFRSIVTSEPVVAFDTIIEYFNKYNGSGKYNALITWLTGVKEKTQKFNDSRSSGQEQIPISVTVIGKFGNMRIVEHAYQDSNTNKQFFVIDLCTQMDNLLDIHHRLIAHTTNRGDALKIEIKKALKKLKPSEIQALEQHGFNKKFINKIEWVSETEPVNEDQSALLGHDDRAKDLLKVKVHESNMYKHMSRMLVNTGFQLAEACMIAHQVVYEGEDVNTAITKLKKKKK